MFLRILFSGALCKEYKMPVQKNVTFFIGNGFDLNIGLKTSYTDFLKWYAKSNYFFYTLPPTGSKTIVYRTFLYRLKRFRKELDKNINRWANLEMALGKYTAYRDLFDTVEAFIDCKYDLDMNLQTYLFSQENKANILNDSDSQNFAEKMITFAKDTPILGNVFNQLVSNATSFRYNIACFNFTNVLHNLFEGIKNVPDLVVEDHAGTQHVTVSNVKGSFIQIHGSLNNRFIQGVDNIDQIDRNEFKLYKRFLQCCIKSEMYNASPLQSRQLEGIIDQTWVYCIFGMSIGESDLTWWKKIGQNLKAHTEKYLIIFTRRRNYWGQAVGYTALELSDMVKQEFYERAGITSAVDQSIIAGRIYVINGSDIFDFSSLKDRIKGQYKVNLNEEITVPAHFNARLLDSHPFLSFLIDLLLLCQQTSKK